MLPCSGRGVQVSPPFGSLPVMLDGKVLGWIPADRAVSIADQLRCLKVNTQADFPATPNLPKDASHAPNLAAGADMSIPAFLEIALLPPPREGEYVERVFEIYSV